QKNNRDVVRTNGEAILVFGTRQAESQKRAVTLARDDSPRPRPPQPQRLKLFTLSGIYHATQTLLAGRDADPPEAKLELAAAFWTEAARYTPAWQQAAARTVSPAELRRDYVHAHPLALAALGRVGCDLLDRHPRDWKQRLARLATLNWSRSNAALWE